MRLACLQGSVGEWDDFVLNALFYLEPVKWTECWCDAVKFAFRCDCSGHVVLDDLEFGDVVCWKVEVEWVAVVKFGLNQGCCNGTGSFKIKSCADTSEVAKVVGAWTWESRDLLVKSEVVVNEKAEVTSVRSYEREKQVKGIIGRISNTNNNTVYVKARIKTVMAKKSSKILSEIMRNL